MEGFHRDSTGLIPISQSRNIVPRQHAVRSASSMHLKARLALSSIHFSSPEGKPWRGRITIRRMSHQPPRPRQRLLGSAATSQFARDYVSNFWYLCGIACDFTYRRMLLHYANLHCCWRSRSISYWF
jgi:hypothetical protein